MTILFNFCTDFSSKSIDYKDCQLTPKMKAKLIHNSMEFLTTPKKRTIFKKIIKELKMSALTTLIQLKTRVKYRIFEIKNKNF